MKTILSEEEREEILRKINLLDEVTIIVEETVKVTEQAIIKKIEKEYVPKEEVEESHTATEHFKSEVTKRIFQLSQKNKEIEELKEELEKRPTLGEIKKKIHKGYSDLVNENIQQKKQLSSSIPIKEVEEMIKEIDKARRKAYRRFFLDKTNVEEDISEGFNKAKQIIQSKIKNKLVEKNRK